MNQFLRRVRRFLAVPSKSVSEGVFRRQKEGWRDAWFIVRTYYLVQVFVAAQALTWIDRSQAIAPSLLWPVAWMPLVGIEPSVIAVHIFTVGTAVLAALWPDVRPLRAFAWLGFFEALFEAPHQDISG